MEKMECRSIPREQCNGGQPRQECSSVPRMQCGDPICQPVYWCRKVIEMMDTKPSVPFCWSSVLFPLATNNHWFSLPVGPL